MKRVFAFVFLPVVLFALETVNLIKDHSFEKNSELWQMYSGPRGNTSLDSAVANRHDSTKAFTKRFSASCDTRKVPGELWPAYVDSAAVVQGFHLHKVVSDLDSLSFSYSVVPRLDNSYFSSGAVIALYLNAGEPNAVIAGYLLRHPDQTELLVVSTKYLKVFTFPNDTDWHFLSQDIRTDLEEGGFAGFKVDSLFVIGWGENSITWRGQKIYWDDIRLMGYADYDVGVKEILSGDSVWEGVYYTPVARIKNFGREDAPEFSVIAEIWEGETRVYYDSLSWSLTSDTEDTVTFADFTPSSAANHTLTVRTVMTPDESDEDDELSKTLLGTAVAEKPVANDFNLEVLGSFSDGVLRVSYSLPYGESGTLTLYDVAGRRIERMTIKGSGKVEFTSTLPSGVYFVKLDTGYSTVTRKAVVLR